MNWLSGKFRREKCRTIADQFLRRRVSALKQLERQRFASRKRFEFYRYLAGVYQLYAELKRADETKNAVQRIADLFNLDTRDDTHLIRVILDASSQADNKAKSRWARALRFAWHERQRWTDLEVFLRESGGPAECASQFAALHPRPPGGCVRVGGENRVPRIPFFVSRDMLCQ